MIVDASAILANVLGEPDGELFLDAILASPQVRMSVANWLEATMVIDRRGTPVAISRFEDFMGDAQIELMPVSVSQAGVARGAWRLFGRGSHPAKLNYGDCFAYALSKESREPLLFKGDDFARTDIESALKD